MLTIKDLFNMYGSWDVYDDIAECIGVAFVADGKNPLTEAGKERFDKILDIPVVINDCYVIVQLERYLQSKNIDIESYSFEGEDKPEILIDLEVFFWGSAGYIGHNDFIKWFKE